VSAHDVAAPGEEGLASVVIDVPAAVLDAGDYILTVEGARDGRREAIGAVPFRVVRSAATARPPFAPKAGADGDR
jgi:hypothetical protein